MQFFDIMQTHTLCLKKIEYLQGGRMRIMPKVDKEEEVVNCIFADVLY